jgi:hypothetical protein
MTVTLAAFAADKGLPVEFLTREGVTEYIWGLRLTYYLRDGTLAPRQRRRTHLVAKHGSDWGGPKGIALVPYGVHQLDDAHETGELWAVEGETDRLTARFHRLPALGIPGATNWGCLAAEHLAGITRLWLVQEPGEGGETFVRLGAERLRAIGWPGSASAVSLDGVKDLNDLHRANPNRMAFIAALEAAKRHARPLLDVAPEHRTLAKSATLTRPLARGHPQRTPSRSRSSPRPRVS